MFYKFYMHFLVIVQRFEHFYVIALYIINIIMKVGRSKGPKEGWMEGLRGVVVKGRRG